MLPVCSAVSNLPVDEPDYDPDFGTENVTEFYMNVLLKFLCLRKCTKKVQADAREDECESWLDKLVA